MRVSTLASADQLRVIHVKRCASAQSICECRNAQIERKKSVNTNLVQAFTVKLIEPTTAEEFEKYFELRWKILRKPWNQPRGSEQDSHEKNAYHIMAVTNEQTIGVARLEFVQPHSAQLRYMAVDDLYQGQGTGHCILKHIEEYARQNHIHILFLNSRENSTGFYQKMGYKKAEKTHVLFGCIQHFRMVKILI